MRLFFFLSLSSSPSLSFSFSFSLPPSSPLSPDYDTCTHTSYHQVVSLYTHSPLRSADIATTSIEAVAAVGHRLGEWLPPPTQGRAVGNTEGDAQTASIEDKSKQSIPNQSQQSEAEDMEANGPSVPLSGGTAEECEEASALCMIMCGFVHLLR